MSSSDTGRSISVRFPRWIATSLVLAATVAAIVAAPARGGDPAGAGAGASYVGAAKCKACHLKVWKSWQKTKMAKVFEVLKPGVSVEAKTKAKLDPQKDYTRDEKCLACHVLGFGKPGGYKVPTAGNKEEEEAAHRLEGVQCESCHGPGGEYVKLMKADEKYPLAKAKELGLVLPNKESCLTCHNDRSPMVGPGYVFDFEKRKKEGTHEHLPLKNKHE